MTIATVWTAPEGRAWLAQGDCLEFMRLGPDESVDCIWTDPPYLLSNDGTTCSNGERTNVNKGAWDRSHGWEADHAFNVSWLTECLRLLKPAGTLWVSGTHHIYLNVGFALQQLGFRILNDIVWEKPNPPPNLGCRCFTHSTETLLWATKAAKGSDDKYTFDYEAMKAENGGKQMKNVWKIKAPGKAEKRHGRYPTQKPLALMDRCLRASTKQGDLVLDPFCGSGGTGVAALLSGRRFFGCDSDSGAIAIALKRLEEAAAQPSTAEPPLAAAPATEVLP